MDCPSLNFFPFLFPYPLFYGFGKTLYMNIVIIWKVLTVSFSSVIETGKKKTLFLPSSSYPLSHFLQDIWLGENQLWSFYWSWWLYMEIRFSYIQNNIWLHDLLPKPFSSNRLSIVAEEKSRNLNNKGFCIHGRIHGGSLLIRNPVIDTFKRFVEFFLP